MNPQNDIVQKVTLANGHIITAIVPNGRIRPSNNARLNEAAFRRYESHITEGIERWPNETAFAIPAGMSPNTFEHRLRDALQALKLFGYEPTLQQRLMSIRDEVCISLDPAGTQVWFRSKGRQGRPLKMHLGEHNTRPTLMAASSVEPAPTEETLHGYLRLARAHPIQFRGRILPDLTRSLEAQYDTAFAYDEGRDVTTML